MWTVAVFSACAVVVGANPYLEEGKRLHDALEYERALERLQLAREVSTSTVEERLETLDLLARVHAALGRLDRSEDMYAEWLGLDPHASIPQNASPPLREAFMAAKRRLFPERFARLRLLPSPVDRIEIALVDPWNAVTDVVLHRRTATGEFVEEPLTVDGRRATYQPSSLSLHFYVEAIAAGETGRTTLATLGTPEAPLVFGASARPGQVSVTAPAAPAAALPGRTAQPAAPTVDGRPRWPAWTLLGVATAAAATGAVLAVSSAEAVRAAEAAHFGSDRRNANERARNSAIGANVAFGAAILSGGAGAYLLWAW